MSYEIVGVEAVRKEMARRLENGEDALEGLEVLETEGGWGDNKMGLFIYEVNQMLMGNTDFTGNVRYRPEAINVNGYEVPAPVKRRLNSRDTYFIPDPHHQDWARSYIWSDDPMNLSDLQRGLIYLDRDSAIKRAKAMAGFDPESED